MKKNILMAILILIIVGMGGYMKYMIDHFNENMLDAHSLKVQLKESQRRGDRKAESAVNAAAQAEYYKNKLEEAQKLLEACK